jgi:hypothetical protein
MERQTGLRWSQRYIWLSHAALPAAARSELNIPLRYRPPAESTVESLTFVVDYLVRRHEVFRTTCHPGAGDGPFQRVHPAGPSPVTVFRTEEHPGSSPADAVNELIEAGFDLASEWPIRSLIVVTGSTPSLLLIVIHRMAGDDWSINRLHQELQAVHQAVLAGQPVSLPPVRHRPEDLTRYEASAAAAKLNDDALRYWDGQLSRVPADMFAPRRVPAAGEPEALSASLSSPSGASAARRLAGRYNAWPNLVYCAAFSMLLVAFTGSRPTSFRTYAANRDTEAQSELMASMSQPVLVTVDHPVDATFAEFVAGLAERAEAALRHSYCAYDEALERMARHSAERGIPLRPGALFNYLSHAPATCGARRTTFIRNPTPRHWAERGDDAYFGVYEYRDGVVVALSAQATVMAADDVERLLRGFETLLCRQADSTGDLRLSDVAQIVGGPRDPGPLPGWVTVDGTRLSLTSIEECLAELPAVDLARVFRTESTAGRAELHAYLATRDETLTASALRRHLLDWMPDVPGVACPHRFQIHAGAPGDVDDIAAWRSLRLIDAGPGTSPPDIDPHNEQEKALHDAVCQANSLDRVSLAASYVAGGGRVLNAPLVQERLLRFGWTGAELAELAGARPLLGVAARLRRVGQDIAPAVPPAGQPVLHGAA